MVSWRGCSRGRLRRRGCGCRGRHGVRLRRHNDDPEFRKLSSRPDGSFAASLAQAAEPSRRSYLSFVEFRLGGSSASGFRV